MVSVAFWAGEALEKRIAQASLEVARATAEKIKGQAVNRAPLDTGALRNSATVTKIENGAEISFNTPYALIMHEKEYTPSHTGTGPNYLRGPLLEEEDKFLEDVRKIMR